MLERQMHPLQTHCQVPMRRWSSDCWAVLPAQQANVALVQKNSRFPLRLAETAQKTTKRSSQRKRESKEMPPDSQEAMESSTTMPVAQPSGVAELHRSMAHEHKIVPMWGIIVLISRVVPERALVPRAFVVRLGTRQ
jgi:hypothetical protein